MASSPTPVVLVTAGSAGLGAATARLFAQHGYRDVAYTQMGRLDVVFSNGGWTRFSITTSLDDNAVEADWDRAFAVNVKSHLWLLQAARPHLDEVEGAFVATSSIAGVQGMGSSLVRFLDPPGSTVSNYHSKDCASSPEINDVVFFRLIRLRRLHSYT